MILIALKNPFNFFDILQQNESLKFPKGPPVFWPFDTVHNSHLFTDIMFSQKNSTDTFLNLSEFGGGGSKILRCIRTSDVIPNLYCVLPKRMQTFETKHSHLTSEHAISEPLTLYLNYSNFNEEEA